MGKTEAAPTTGKADGLTFTIGADVQRDRVEYEVVGWKIHNGKTRAESVSGLASTMDQLMRIAFGHKSLWFVGTSGRGVRCGSA